MSGAVLPVWLFVAVALLIALVAFAAGQALPGAGIIVAAGGSTLWTAFIVRRGVILRGRNG